LLDAVEQGAVPPGDVPPVRRTILMRSGDAALQARATKLFGGEATPAERKALIARYRTALAAEGPPDLARGAAVFQRDCANCHKVGDAGYDVGPALTTIKGRTPVEVLEHVLDPNREVSPQHLEYLIVTHDGRITTGTIAVETATSITLRQAGGKQETVLRSEIDMMQSSGKSLMPEGLEQKATPEEMRDLIGFLLQP
jgi:putative heme-binding domain-containing protein